MVYYTTYRGVYEKKNSPHYCLNIQRYYSCTVSSLVGGLTASILWREEEGWEGGGEGERGSAGCGEGVGYGPIKTH
jgi:hypothetical protein